MSGNLLEDILHLWQYLAELPLEWEMFETKAVEEIKHAFYVKQLFSENRAFYDIMWKSMVQVNRPQVTI